MWYTNLWIYRERNNAPLRKDTLDHGQNKRKRSINDLLHFRTAPAAFFMKRNADRALPGCTSKLARIINLTDCYVCSASSDNSGHD